MRKKRVILGMSGGIDSSVAAYLLLEQGFEVIGITLKLFSGGSRCCDISDIVNAQILASKLGIKHYVIDREKEFKKYVVDYFVNTYLEGKTPNPCVVCNEFVKIPFLFQELKTFEGDYIATGHYAKIVKEDNSFFLTKAKDKFKSQEYFLSRVNQDLFPYILFPLGGYIKEETKKLALTIASKIDYSFRTTESQEVCFVKPGEHYIDFIKDYSGKELIYNGEILVENEPSVKKRVDNILKFTIGQRKGLGISYKEPLYVKYIDLERRQVIVTTKEKLGTKSFSLKNIITYKELSKNKVYDIKIRYKTEPIKGRIEDDKVILEENALGVAPGQLAVIYEDDKVVASGWIER